MLLLIYKVRFNSFKKKFINTPTCQKYLDGYNSSTFIHDISPSSNQKSIQHSLLESPRQYASNGGVFELLASIDGKIFVKVSKT